MIFTLVRHEWRRALRTKRVWIVLAFCLFSAFLDPVSTKFLPKIIEAVGKLEVVGLPDQSAADALKAYASDSSRLAMLAFALSFMGMATDEFKRDSGAGAFVFTRGVKSSSLVWSKLIVAFGVGWGSFLIGYLVATLISLPLFGSVPVGAVLKSVPLTGLFWLMAAALLVGGGAAFRSALAAVATAYGSLFFLSIFELFGVLAAWSPTALGTSVGPLAAGEPMASYWRSLLVGGICAGVIFVWGLVRKPN